MPDRDVSVARHFAGLPDPGIDRTEKHALGDIPVIARRAVTAGADSREEVEASGEAKAGRLKGLPALPNGVPTHDTSHRVFARPDPQAFGRCVAGWMAGVCEAAGLRHLAVDGKAVRAAPGSTLSGCLHRVSAWAAGNRLILGRRAVADGSHEIAAIPEPLKVLALEAALVAIDAAGCPKEIAKRVRGRGGGYLLAVKGNQPKLHDAVSAVLDRACESDSAGVGHDGHGQVEDGHGRHEGRDVTAIHDPRGRPPEWPDGAAVGREREGNGSRTDTAHSSGASRRGTAAELGNLIRRHWSVENELHWCLDVAFREDGNETAAGHAGANLGLVRRVAASLLTQDPEKGSIKRERLTAALEEGYRTRVLQGFTDD